MKSVGFVAMLLVAVLVGGCESNTVNGPASPRAAYAELFASVKSKDTARIKKSLSTGSLSFAEFVSKQQNKPIEDVLKNGFTETTFSDSLPEMRDERVKDGSGQIEVYSSKSGKWEVIPFVRENGVWKAAFGELFSGQWKSPGKSMSQLEQERQGGPATIPANGNPTKGATEGFPMDPGMERDAMKKPNPTLGSDATPVPVPNNPTLK